MKQLSFHFDYLSPYAYFAWRWVREVCDEHDTALICEPTMLGVLLAHHGHLGPAEIPSKREFVFRDVLRIARREGVALAIPHEHPFHSVGALRVSQLEVAGDDQLGVIDAIWRATWEEGRAVATSDALADVLTDAGFDGAELMARAASNTAKVALRSRMEAAVERGIFGVPSFVVDGELFWGNDQRQFVEDYLRGERGYSEAHLRDFLATPFGVRRRR